MEECAFVKPIKETLALRLAVGDVVGEQDRSRTDLPALNQRQ